MPKRSSEMVALGSAIAELRREKCLTTDALAREAQLAPEVLEQIEGGEIEATLLDVVAVANALGSNPQRLFARAGL